VGQKVYRLVELREKTGYAALVTKVVDENGKPITNLPVTFYWSGAPWPPDPPTEVYAHDWYNRFTWGRTNENGDVGPGMGTGAYHGWGEGGPHAVWVHDPDIPSDICEKLGMLAGTFHDHLDQKFQLVTVEEEEPVNDKLDEVLAVVKDNKALLLEIKTILTTQPPEPPPPPEPPEETFTVQYFNNTTLSGTPVWTTTQKPPFWNDWGSGSPNAKVNADNFSGRWLGTFTFAAKTYTFNVKADDGIRLWVAGKLVIDQWHDQAPTVYSVKVPMTAGAHEVKIEWYEKGGGATLHANWE